MLWRNKEEALLNYYSKNHIDLTVSIEGWPKFRITGICGEPDRAKRRETWQLIKNLCSVSDLPWCLIGDMNNVVQQSDKKGGRAYPGWLIRGFCEMLEDCGLIDMELIGYPYTWERSPGTESWVEIRLDRALTNASFMSNFQEAKLTNMGITTSDHCPILLEPVSQSRTMYVKRFKFENAWLREPMCR